MTAIIASLAVAGVASPLPPPVTLGQRIDLVLRFTAGGAPPAATGVTLTTQQPDGQERVYTAESMEAGDPGVWTISLPLDQVGAWAFRARCAGPQDAAAPEVVVRVLGSSILPQPAAGPILVTDELEPIELPGGTPTVFKRITALPRPSNPAGLVLAGAQDGEARSVAWEVLETGAAAAGEAAGTEAGAAAGRAAGAEAGASAGATAGSAAGAAAGATAGADAAAPAVTQAQESADTATAKAGEADASATVAAVEHLGAEQSAQAAASAALSVPGAYNVGRRAIYRDMVPGFAAAWVAGNGYAVGWRADGAVVATDLDAYPDIPTARHRKGYRLAVLSDANGRAAISLDPDTGQITLTPSPDLLKTIGDVVAVDPLEGNASPAGIPAARHRAGYLLPIVADGSGRAAIGVEPGTGRVTLLPSDQTIAQFGYAAYRAPDKLRGVAQAMNVRAISAALQAGLVQEADGRVSEVVQLSAGSGTLALVNDPRPLHAILITGQSRAGNPDCDGDSPFLTAPRPHHAVMFNGGPAKSGATATNPADLTSLVPLRDGASVTLPSLTTMAGYALEEIDRAAGRRSPGRIWRADNYSGASLNLIIKGTQCYANLMASAAQVPAVAAPYGRAATVPAVVFVQGESGPQDGTYATMLSTYLDDMPADVRAATGQATAPRTVIVQIDEADSAGDHTVSRLALLDAARARAGSGVVMAGPGYQFPRYLGSENHEGVRGRAMLGEMVADVLGALKGPADTWDGAWAPLWSTAISRNGAVIEITYSRPYGLPLEWDDDWIKPVPNRGYAYSDDSGAPPSIVSVEIVGADTVRITLSAAPTGGNRTLSYALINESPNAVDGWTKGRGHLRVDTGRPSAYAALGLTVPATIRHYAVAERIAVP